MKQFLLVASTLIFFTACNSSKKNDTPSKKDTPAVDAAYLVSKDGIGDIKIGMTQAELEKLLNQALTLKHANEKDIWSDTATAKYKDIDVMLFFEKQYAEDENAPRIMQLMGVNTSSAKCKTATGIGVGDDKAAIVAAYDDSPIDMGPEFFMVNDSTWEPSKNKFYVNVKDDKYDKQISFRLVDKKVAALEASIIMGE